MAVQVLTPCLLVSSADNLCKQARQNVEPDLDLNYLTLIVFLKEYFKNDDFENKHQQMTKNHAKCPMRQRVNSPSLRSYQAARQLLKTHLEIFSRNLRNYIQATLLCKCNKNYL